MLQEQWSALIANAAIASQNDDVPPYFATALGQMSPVDARLLTLLAEYPRPEGLARTQFYLPEAILLEQATTMPEQRALAAIDLLESLGFVARDWQGAVFTGPWDPTIDQQREPIVRLTALGERFWVACRPPIPV